MFVFVLFCLLFFVVVGCCLLFVVVGCSRAWSLAVYFCSNLLWLSTMVLD